MGLNKYHYFFPRKNFHDIAKAMDNREKGNSTERWWKKRGFDEFAGNVELERQYYESRV